MGCINQSGSMTGSFSLHQDRDMYSLYRRDRDINTEHHELAVIQQPLGFYGPFKRNQQTAITSF